MYVIFSKKEHYKRYTCSVLIGLSASVNNFNGTGVHTFSAVFTFIVINGCMEVFDFDCSCRALFLTHFTADTAVFAGKLCSFAVIA